MRILLTGAGGFLGRPLQAQLRAAGHEVLAWTRTGAQAVELFDATAREQALHEACRPAPVDTLVHLAWIATPGIYLQDPSNIEHARVAEQLVEQALALGVRRIVGVGTCLEYARDLRPRHAAHSPLAPDSLYARSKLAFHRAALERCARAGAELAWARVFHVFGPGEPAAKLTSYLVDRLRAGQPAELGPGDAVRDFVSLDDVTRGLAMAASGRLTGCFNLASGQATSVRQLAELVAEELGAANLLRWGARPAAADEDPYLVADLEELRAQGMLPRVDLRQGVRALLASRPPA